VSLADRIIEAIRQGYNTYSSLCKALGDVPPHSIRATVSKLVKRGRIIRPRNGVYILAEDSASPPAAKKLWALQELSSLTTADMWVLHSMALSGTSSLQELVDEVGENATDAVGRLEEKGFISLEGDKVSLSPKGAYVASFLYTYLYMILRSQDQPTLKDAQAEMYRLAGILEAVMLNREAILSSIESLRVAAESLNRNVAKLSRLVPREPELSHSQSASPSQ